MKSRPLFWINSLLSMTLVAQLVFYVVQHQVSDELTNEPLKTQAIDLQTVSRSETPTTVAEIATAQDIEESVELHDVNQSAASTIDLSNELLAASLDIVSQPKPVVTEWPVAEGDRSIRVAIMPQALNRSRTAIANTADSRPESNEITQYDAETEESVLAKGAGDLPAHQSAGTKDEITPDLNSSQISPSDSLVESSTDSSENDTADPMPQEVATEQEEVTSQEGSNDSGIKPEQMLQNPADSLNADRVIDKPVAESATRPTSSLTQSPQQVLLEKWQQLAASEAWLTIYHEINTKLTLVTGDTDLGLLAAKAAYQQQDYELSQTLLQNINLPSAQELLALTYYRLGQYKQSSQLFKELLSQADTKGEWWLWLALSLENTADRVQALAAYRNFLATQSSGNESLRKFARNRVEVLSQVP